MSMHPVQASSEAKKDPGVKEPEEAMDSQAGVKEEAATQLPSPVQQDGQTAPLDHNTEVGLNAGVLAICTLLLWYLFRNQAIRASTHSFDSANRAFKLYFHALFGRDG